MGTKVKHFQVKPEHVEAMQFGGRNATDIVDWVNLFTERYNIIAKNYGAYITIQAFDSDVIWRVNNSDWVVRSFVNQYFYVEPDAVMIDQYIKL